MALALAACGDSDAAPTDLPTRATPIAAYSLSPRESVDESNYARETNGLEFVPWVDIEVTVLGYYDEGDDGLVNEHTVGILEKSNRQLVSDTVTVDGGSTLEGAFRYEEITPVVLKGGTFYVLAGSTHSLYDLMAGGTDAAWAPELRYARTATLSASSRFRGGRGRSILRTSSPSTSRSAHPRVPRRQRRRRSSRSARVRCAWIAVARSTLCNPAATHGASFGDDFFSRAILVPLVGR